MCRIAQSVSAAVLCLRFHIRFENSVDVRSIIWWDNSSVELEASSVNFDPLG